MSRMVLGDCIDVMGKIPTGAIDFILTDPPYLVGFKDRGGREIANDKSDEWLVPASKEMYRVLKPNSLAVSFYGWNRVDKFVNAWKTAGFRIVGHLVFTKPYSSKATFVGYRHECAYLLAKGKPPLPEVDMNVHICWPRANHRCQKRQSQMCLNGSIRGIDITPLKSQFQPWSR